MTFPAFVISETKLQVFKATFLEAPGIKLIPQKGDSEVERFDVVLEEDHLLLSVSPLFEAKGYFQIKWKFRTRTRSSSRKLNELLFTSLRTASAVPIESFVKGGADNF